LIAVIVPDTAQVNVVMKRFHDDFLLRVPWGYATLVGEDLLGYNTVSTSTFSNLAITFPSTGGFSNPTASSTLAGKTITFVNWEALATSTESGTFSSLIHSFDTFFNLVFGLGFAYWLWRFFIKHMHP